MVTDAFNSSNQTAQFEIRQYNLNFSILFQFRRNILNDNEKSFNRKNTLNLNFLCTSYHVRSHKRYNIDKVDTSKSKAISVLNLILINWFSFHHIESRINCSHQMIIFIIFDFYSLLKICNLFFWIMSKVRW